MSAEAPENLLREWSRLVASTLVGQGISRVVMSPGSRSTPYVVALAARPELDCIDVVDERCAAFMALGMARASGQTTALLCTSGTAVAHWYPAVIEASMSDVPLLLLSADRPFELLDCGAPQTIDQTKIFGDHVRHFVETGSPEASDLALRGLRASLVRAIARTRGPRPGPVHVNLRARKPLEPRAPFTDAGHALASRAEALMALPPTLVPTPRVAVEGELVADAASLLRAARRPLIVVGPLPVSAAEDGTREAVWALARALGAPVYAEATSQCRFVGPTPTGVTRLDAFDLVLGSAPDLAPDAILQVGAPPVASAFERHLSAHPSVLHVVLGVGSHVDPLGRAQAVVLGHRLQALQAFTRALEGTARDDGWLAQIAALDARALRAIDDERAGPEFGEGAVAHAVVEALPEDGWLTVGNSLPIRMIDRFAHGPARPSIKVLSQRGANGIDGLISAALGVSRTSAAPGVLLLGDLSALHDLGALASASLARAPLAVVLVQNGGGRIFETLPVAREPSTAWALPHFTTPTTLQFDALARGFGVPHVEVRDRAGLQAALRSSLGRPGLTLIEAVVPPHGASASLGRIASRCASFAAER